MAGKLSPTLENYLETIFRLVQARGFARVRDIAEALDVAKSAVTVALKNLARKKLVDYRPYEPVTLTELGSAEAHRIVTRHLVMKDFLENVLLLDTDRADAVACDMEHTVDAEVLERFLCFLAFIKRHAPDGETWLKEFRRFVKKGASGHSCRECIDDYLREIKLNGNDGA
jgi:DtxR family Mn-dependent transcriptional regulator